VKIRPMEERDFAIGVELISQFNTESLGEYGNYLELDRLMEIFRKIWHTSFVVEVNEKVVGLFVGHIVQDFCSKRPVYEEVVWYVSLGFRKYGLKLFHHVQDWCKAQGIERMTVCCMHNSKTEKLFRLYDRLGFKSMETRFIKELN